MPIRAKLLFQIRLVLKAFFIKNNNGEIFYIAPTEGAGADVPLEYKEYIETFVNDGNVESTTKGENGFIIQFNGKVYDNETIYVYSDSGCTTLIGNFVAKYGVTEYALDAVMSVSRSTTLFSSNLFGTSSTVDLDSNTEMANITKLEYEILVSKVNQLMKLLKNKK